MSFAVSERCVSPEVEATRIAESIRFSSDLSITSSVSFRACWDSRASRAATAQLAESASSLPALVRKLHVAWGAQRRDLLVRMILTPPVSGTAIHCDPGDLLASGIPKVGTSKKLGEVAGKTEGGGLDYVRNGENFELFCGTEGQGNC